MTAIATLTQLIFYREFVGLASEGDVLVVFALVDQVRT